MAKKFNLGDHASWNSEAGRVSGTIVAVHIQDFDHKGHTHHASADDPQYEIKSDKTDHGNSDALESKVAIARHPSKATVTLQSAEDIPSLP